MAEQDQNNPPESDANPPAGAPDDAAQPDAPQGDAAGSSGDDAQGPGRAANRADAAQPGPTSVTDAQAAAASKPAGTSESDANDPEQALDDVEHKAGQVASAANDLDGDAQTFDLPAFSNGAHANASGAGSLELLKDVDLSVKVELGRTRMYVEDVLKLNENTVVELDKAAGDPVDIFVNGRLVARGEVLVLNENFCVRVSEIISDLSTVPPDNDGEGDAST
jgi:flagellar motor switch protein FliN